MGTSANDVIQAAYEELGVYAPGDTISSADVQRGLLLLNEMISSWNEEYLPIFSLTALSLTIAPNASQYTIGAGGYLSVPRPMRIDYGQGAASVTISAVTTAVNIVSEVEWLSIYSINPGSGAPNTLFYDPQYPLGALNVAPTPVGTGSLAFNGWYGFLSFQNLATTYNFPPGTVDALKHNLSVVAKPFFNEAPINQETMMRALETKAALRKTNMTSRAMMKRASPAQRTAQGGNRT